MEGWQLASKGLGPLPRRRGSALAHGCGRGGRVVLPVPLARAAAVSTRLRVQVVVLDVPAEEGVAPTQIDHGVVDPRDERLG